MSLQMLNKRTVKALALLGVLVMVGMGLAPAVSGANTSGLSVYELYQGNYLNGARDLGSGAIAIGRVIYSYKTAATLSLLATVGLGG